MNPDNRNKSICEAGGCSSCLHSCTKAPDMVSARFRLFAPPPLQNWGKHGHPFVEKKKKIRTSFYPHNWLLWQDYPTLLCRNGKEQSGDWAWLACVPHERKAVLFEKTLAGSCKHFSCPLLLLPLHAVRLPVAGVLLAYQPQTQLIYTEAHFWMNVSISALGDIL